jgi:RNA polymerase sigma-70 factor (ECF subfamily)
LVGLVCHINERGSHRTGLLTERGLSAEDVGRLYDQHGPALLAYACSFVADGAAAEDIVHGVFTKLLNGRPAARIDIPVAYLYRAVRNEALNARRNGARHTQLEETKPCFVHRNGDREAALALQEALHDLPEEQRAVVIMRIWAGMTLDEVAATTEVSVNTASSRYRYAVEKLRERLEPYQVLRTSIKGE